MIQAYISMPDKKWTKEDFRNLTKEGKKAFDSAWKELKDFGYLKVHFMLDNGKWKTEYELLDEPDLGPHTLYHNSEGEVSSDNLTRAEKKRQTQTVTDEHSSFQADNADEDTEIGDSDRYPLLVLTVILTVTPLSVATVTVVTLTVATQTGVTIIKTII